MRKLASPTALATAYLLAKEFVLRQGFDQEIDWQEDLSLENLTESDFLRETAWVILCSGFRENILRNKFQEISVAFLLWESAPEITRQRKICRKRALGVFGHKLKIEAILAVADRTAKDGFAAVKRQIQSQGMAFLQELPYIGPVTAFHLAKNLGLMVVKPDRHLVRVAQRVGYDSPDHLCRTIGSLIAEKISVVDLVIWRYATLNPKYETWFHRTTSLCRAEFQ
jgi:hypothetical protein